MVSSSRGMTNLSNMECQWELTQWDPAAARAEPHPRVSDTR